MKYLLIIGLLAFQTDAYSQTTKPSLENIDTIKTKLVTGPEFLKHLSATNQNAPGEMLNVVFLFKARDRDAIAVKYNGGANYNISNVMDFIESGDKIIVEPENKESKVLPKTYIIK